MYLTSKKKVLLTVMAFIILLIGIPTISHLPVHRTNIIYTDISGDVTDPNFDIVQIRSFAEAQYIVLELTVAGVIQTEDSERSYPLFLYRINVVAKGLNDVTAHIYACTFRNGVRNPHGFDTEVENATLRIFFPWTFFIPDSYMIGLEGRASNGLENDYTLSDRNSAIARLLF